MKLKRKKPCKECPFRKESARTWLGPWTVREIFDHVHGEGGFGCHMDAAVQLKKNPTDDELADRVHVCVGSLQHASKSCKSYRDPELDRMRLAVGKDDDNILGYAEFVEHHSSLNPKKKVK